MYPGARTPEELDGLLEDAFVLGGVTAFDQLFEDAALLVADSGIEARGAVALGTAFAALRDSGLTYVSHPVRVLQSRDTALVISRSGTHVMRRGRDRSWRSAISLLDLTSTDRSEDT